MATADRTRDGAEGSESYRKRQLRAFAEARRHSRLVMVLRNAIPAVCVVAIATMVLFTVFDPFRKVETVAVVSTEGITGSKITMQFPKLSGYKKDLRSYDVTADSAVQEVKRPTVMELFNPNARIEIEKDKYARVTAASGVYDSSAEKMKLDGNVMLKSDAGYDIRMEHADIDLKAGAMTSQQPVSVKMNTGSIHADTIEVEDSGKVIHFRGHVVTMFDAVDTAAADPAKREADDQPSGAGIQ
ncbi:MAG: LPS export ABC transporter periplasmic protein LptC [Beijerinckiaceae bacterium]|nr:LPS export ABC transporter periplasmic protein LptC [Beijerinckiaceae bacterium]